MTANSGYSGTLLEQKLGISAGAVVAAIDEPPDFRASLEPITREVVFRESLRGRPDIVMLFVESRSAFERRFPVAARAIFPAGSIWVSWPKKASGVITDMTGDVVRAVALPKGLVDNKVCSIDATWTGLRVVWRLEHRGEATPPTLGG
jgi:hypothetical protein